MKRASAQSVALCLLLALCLPLTGCVPLYAELHTGDSHFEMPVPEEAPAGPAVGDEILPRTVPATLYCPSEDGQELSSAAAEITVGAGETLPQRLVGALLEDAARGVAPEGTSALSVRQSGGTVVVDLSLEARAVETPRQLFLMRAAIVKTLCGAEGVSCADVLISGRALPVTALPCGAGRPNDAPLAVQWSQALSEAELAGEGAVDVSRTAVLYHPARNSRLIVPETREITIEQGDALSALLDALSDDGALDPAVRPILPDSDAAIITGAELVTLADGRRVARLTFDGNLSAILDRARLNAWQMYASLACTLTGFLPDLDGIQVYVGDGLLTRVDSPAGEVALDNGVMHRAMFERTIGQLETIYMTASDGSLRPLGRPMRAEEASSPRQLLALLFEEPRPWEADVSRVVPDGLTIDDLLGVRVEDGIATLNFSKAFHAGCQRLNSQQERNLVFALVNTLTEHPAVRAVRIQIEGEALETLVHEISLLSPLMRNPGVISAPDV
ncbi:MAG: GerMN domain-containing protein [Clostridia bacterium]|nr:GerMN domain-containing protein [Clostridia bacterium]